MKAKSKTKFIIIAIAVVLLFASAVGAYFVFNLIENSKVSITAETAQNDPAKVQQTIDSIKAENEAKAEAEAEAQAQAARQAAQASTTRTTANQVPSAQNARELTPEELQAKKCEGLIAKAESLSTNEAIRQYQETYNNFSQQEKDAVRYMTSNSYVGSDALKYWFYFSGGAWAEVNLNGCAQD